jgi:hypothetical protein
VKLPKWLTDEADKYINECCSREHPDDFLAGARFVLERLQATGSWGPENPNYDPENLYYEGRESVRKEMLE